MRRISALAAAAAVMCAACPAAAVAQDVGWYGDLGIGYTLEPDFDTGGVVGRFGYEQGLRGPFDAVAYEGEVFYGVLSDEIQTSFGTVDSKVEYAFSGSVRGVKTLTNRIDGFARIGIAYASVEVDDSNQFNLLDSSEDDTDILIGLGGKYRLGQRSGVRGDFTLQNDFEVLSLTYSYDF